MDTNIRLAAFEWIKKQNIIYHDVLPWNVLQSGFEFNGQRIVLIGAKGIWKPKQMELPISIQTSLKGPYEDLLDKGGLLNYKYRGTDYNHPDNVGLRWLMQKRIPLIYFHAIAKGKYLASAPVYLINENPGDYSFTVAVDDINYVQQSLTTSASEQESVYRRSYLTTNARVRLHQQSFRERVLHAYSNQCTLCRLKHPELLDAAHIIGDLEDEGLPIVQNGLSLCKIHHAAFDSNIIGISPDYIVHVREDILHEIDGPMLKYGIQSMDKNKIILPRDRASYPDKERLEVRFDTYKNVS